jgi:hypothetical protein
MNVARPLVCTVVCAFFLGAVPSAQDAVAAIAVSSVQLFSGATNLEITPDNIQETICKKGWSTKCAPFTPVENDR